MREPFNSQAPHFLTKVKAYCAKVLPLVFDNSLSYYEFLGKMCHKLNECIDALNSQNLNIVEFTHMVQLEIENFEKYIDSRMTEYENELKQAWEEYKAEINNAFAEFKNEMLSAWEEEKAINEKFRTDLLNDFNELKEDIINKQETFENLMQTAFNTFKDSINSKIEQFEQATNADLTQFKNTMQTQQNEFENHMVELFNNFKTTEKQARTDFESNFQQLFEQWKIDTLYALNQNITDWETDTQAEITAFVEEKYIVFNTTLAGEMTKLQNSINNEANARESADNNLQSQINQLTDESSIKADETNQYNNSQLYTIDKTTEQRQNIYPMGDISTVKAETVEDDATAQLFVVNPETLEKTNFMPKCELSTIYLTHNPDTTKSKLQFVMEGPGFMIHEAMGYEGHTAIERGVSDLGEEFIKIHISKLPYKSFSGLQPYDVLARIQFNFNIYMSQSAMDFGGVIPITFMLYNCAFSGEYFTCGVKAINTSDKTLHENALIITNANFING